jgi:hypothetical protein
VLRHDRRPAHQGLESDASRRARHGTGQPVYNRSTGGTHRKKQQTAVQQFVQSVSITDTPELLQQLPAIIVFPNLSARELDIVQYLARRH